jgi:hypothetical protein
MRKIYTLLILLRKCDAGHKKLQLLRLGQICKNLHRKRELVFAYSPAAIRVLVQLADVGASQSSSTSPRRRHPTTRLCARPSNRRAVLSAVGA